MAIAIYRHMPAEIESLKQVLDMRNEEIFKLRNKNIELGKTVGFLALLAVITLCLLSYINFSIIFLVQNHRQKFKIGAIVEQSYKIICLRHLKID